MSDQPTLFLCDAALNPSRAVRSASATRWLLLDEDYLRSSEWRRTVEDLDRQVVPAGSLIASAADYLRRPFLDLVADTGRLYNSPAWWASRLSERNTAVRPLFLHCCYVHVALTEIARGGGLGIMCQSQAVLDAIEESGIASEATVRRLRGRGRAVMSAELIGRWGLRIVRFLWKGCVRRMQAPPRPDRGDRPRVLISTYADEASFGADRRFSDRYFPGLQGWLEQRGKTVLTMPSLASVGGSRGKAWRKLTAFQGRFLAPETFLRFPDYLFAVLQAARGARMPRGQFELAGLDVTALIRAERLATAFDGGTLDVLALHRLPRRLASAGFEIDLLIQTYENMIDEKMLTLGFRRYMPATRMASFQHGALYPNLLCNFVTAGEARIAPLPDRVVCNGDFFREILVKEGLPGERAVTGPALRYRHLRGSESEQSEVTPSRDVLVPLPLVPGNLVELLHKLLPALGDDTSLRVLLKPHPMATGGLPATGGVQRLPVNFEVVAGTMGTLLPRVGAVVALASSALHESLAAGVPVVPVGRAASLDLNPLAWEPGLNKVFRSPKEIRAEVFRLLSLSPDELNTYRTRSRKVLAHSFAPVTEESMAIFTDGLLDE